MRVSRWVLAVCAAGSVSLAAAQEADVLELAAGWRLQSSAHIDVDAAAIASDGYDAQSWYPTAVPCTVLAALVDNNVYPDPYYGLNLKSVPGYKEGRWLLMSDDSPFDVPWWYRTEFEVPPDWDGRHIMLHLDGINYQANVWLNGERIADSEQVIAMFRRFEFDVTNLVRPGQVNVLAVETIPPGQLPEKEYQTKQVEATTGWDDHNPQPPDMNLGIWEDVYLTASGPVRLKHPYVSAELEVPGLSSAALTMSVYAENLSDSVQTAVVSGTCEHISVEKAVELAPGENRLIEFTPSTHPQLELANPRVWWPHPVGPQELYEAEFACSAEGEPSDAAATRFGIREATSYINDEDWRTYTINGHRILIRGGAWMTSDMLLRFTHRRYDALVRYAREAGLNMLRSEGFSIRETEEFYSLCDKYGVMVTQQIFGRSIPREDLAIACTEDTILRIRKHPSLVHFLGHDETFPTDTLDEAYRGLIARHTPSRTYQPHSGAFNVADRQETGGTRTGTRQLWTYANPTQYYVRKEDGAWGFAQSGGIGGIVAPYHSALRMVPEDQLWPLWSEALSFHTVIQGAEFFDVVVEMVEKRYGKPSNLEEFCRKAGVMNYECARAMFEAYGRNKYAATGITTWKYNAAWPAFMTWQYIDWYLNATDAYYGAQTACRPLHIQYSYDDATVYVVNSLYEVRRGLQASARIYNMDMSLQYEKTARVDVGPDGHSRAFAVVFPEGLTQSHFLVLTLRDALEHPIDQNVYWLSTTPDVRGEVSRGWTEYWERPESIADHTALNDLPGVRLEVASDFETVGDEVIGRVTLLNPGETIAFFTRLDVAAGETERVVSPAFWSANCFSLLPGQKREVTVTLYERDLAGARPRVRVDGWNVAANE